MTIVLLSLKPEFAARILAREKQFEFRRTRFKRQMVSAALMYSSCAERRIVGAFEIDRIHEGAPTQLWAKYRSFAGIGEGAFFEYFEGVDRGYAIGISRVHKFSPAIDPRKALPGFVPPQSFCYLSAQQTKRLLPPGMSAVDIDHRSSIRIVLDGLGVEDPGPPRWSLGSSAVRVPMPCR